MSSQPPFGHDADPPTVEGSLGAYPPAGPPPAPPQMPIAAPADRGRSGGMAPAGLVLALVSMACLIAGIGVVLFRHAPGVAAVLLFWGMPLGVIGIVLSAVGHASAPWRGSGTAGLILSSLAVGLTALFLLAGLAAASARGPGRLRPPRLPHPAGSGAPVLVHVYSPRR